MADEKIYEWSSDKALSKVKIGNETYKLKDAEARDVIDAEVSRATAAEEALAAAISDEETRATAAEASLRADLATEVSARASGDAALDKRVSALEARGRYLSTWDASTGLPGDYPTIPEGATSPYTYTYKAGDYYIINNVPSTGTKYMPDGASITATKSGDVWTWSIGKKAYEGETHLVIGGQFLYSTSSWTYVATAKDVAWGNITGNLSDQTDLKNALGGKVDKVTGKSLVDDTEITKLAGIEAGAEVNIIEKVKVDGTALTVDSSDRSVNIVGIAGLQADITKKANDNAVVHLAGEENISGTKTFSDGLTSVGNITINTADINFIGSSACKITGLNAGTSEKDAVNKGQLDTKQDVIDDSHKLSADLVADGSVNHVFTAEDDAKLAGIASGAQVNVIEKIRLNGSDLVVGSEKRVDLGYLNAGSVIDVAYDSDTHKLTQVKANGSGSTTTDVHTFGALAEKSSASGTVDGQTITGIQATGTSTGEISVQLDHTATAIESTGSIVATGTVGVTLKNNTVQSVKSVGTLPSFTEGAYTPASIGSDFFNAGAKATYSHSGFSGGSLGEATKATFASEGLKAHVGVETSSEDKECLYFEAAGTAQALTAQGTFTAAVYGTDTFDGGTLPSIDTTKFNGGSKAADTWSAGSLPEKEEITVGVSGATFTGSSVNVSVSGSYEKATVNSSGTKFTGKAITLSVGDIEVSAKDVTVQ